MSFASDFKRAKENIRTESEKRVVALAANILSGTVEMTPVAKGRLRGNWQVDINAKPNEVLEVTDKTGSSTIAKGTSNANKYDLGDTVYLTNNLPYAYRIEYLGYSSVKAPGGMLRITVDNVTEAARLRGWT